MKHVIATLSGDFSNNLKIHQYMLDACKQANLTVLNISKHEFYPQGLTTIAVLAESHFAVHTYPEKNTAWADCFTCAEDNDPEKAIKIFAELLGCEILSSQLIDRN